MVRLPLAGVEKGRPAKCRVEVDGLHQAKRSGLTAVSVAEL
jgi:hypothetical protein